MTETLVSIGLNTAGFDRVALVGSVGNDMNVTWYLTDSQLGFLLGQGIQILRSRYQSKQLDMADMKNQLLELLNV